MKPYLVTGGCGFVGRHLVKRLTNFKRDIWIIDNLFIGKHPDVWISKLGFKKLTTKDNLFVYSRGKQKIYFLKEDLVEILSKELIVPKLLPTFSDVFHLASIVGGRELIDGDPILIAKDLAIDSIFFLWATRKPSKAERVLYASSSAAYPTHLQNKTKKVALKEKLINFRDLVGVPDMTYGWSKLTGEYLSRLAAKHYQIHVACVRPFSGYGEDQDLSYPIPAIAQRTAKRENPLTVWGTGMQGRDFVYIDDCIDAFFVILDNIKDGSGYNIGSGKIMTFLEVIDIFTKLEGYTPKIKPLTTKPVGVIHRYSDISSISKFGWYPKTPLETGLAKVLIAAKNRLLGI